MLWRTHLISGLTVGCLVSSMEPYAIITAGVASLLPDLDHPNSYIGSKIPIMPTLLKVTFGHRGVFHSALASLIVFLAAIPLWSFDLALAAGAGYLTHVLTDLFTVSGIPFLWPIKKRFSLSLLKTGGLLERYIVFPTISICLLFLLANSISETWFSFI